MSDSENVSIISTNEKLDKIMKMINDMKTTQNKLITSVNSNRDQKKKIKTRNLLILRVSWILYPSNLIIF